ncbi:hypothetical protein [Legionella drancourtii]|uniref:hypothetical protein n=1 Tax=Legionella drancourtii TaxID=168933 RepID=UPI0001B01B23|nr:hypothetical protein [Legionella drancourtii]
MNRLLNRQFNFYASFFSLILTMSMSGCVDLSGAKYHPSPKKITHHADSTTQKIAQTKKHKPYRGEVHTMLGGLGVFSTGMKELSSSVVDKYDIPAPSSMWYNAGNVSRSIVTYYYKHKNHRPIILVGHSLGANEQIKVARNLDKLGIPVDLLVTVDAVSQTVVPPNVKHVMNFYKPGYVPMFSGLKLRAIEPDKTRLENINVSTLKGVAVNHFTIDKDPVVQAMIMDEVKKVTYNANRAKA